jgi:hypothetical protein
MSETKLLTKEESNTPNKSFKDTIMSAVNYGKSGALKGWNFFQAHFYNEFKNLFFMYIYVLIPLKYLSERENHEMINLYLSAKAVGGVNEYFNYKTN